MRGIVLELSSKEATDFLLPRHYAGRIPSISRAFGWKVDGALKAVCTFGKPATPFLCTGVCGKKYSASVYELNRLCRVDGFKEPLSAFVGACLRRLRAMNWIIISYSDTQMNHHGYIYQATNFLYTGMTKERTDMYTGGGGQSHNRHYEHAIGKDYDIRKVRSSKHRYVYFCTRDKRLKREWMKSLNYPILPYPKGDNNADYKLGTYMKPILINRSTGKIVGWQKEPCETNSQWLDRLLG